MALFDNIPAYRPPLSIVTQPARAVPTLADLKIRVIEGIKTSVIVAGLLANEKVTVRDTGCGDFISTGTLARFTTNGISVDPLMAQFKDCATTYEGTILQAMLKAGHAYDPNLEGTEIERLAKAYMEGGSTNLTPIEMQTFAPLLDLALADRVTSTIYRDALRLWMLGDKASADVNYNGTDGIRKKLLAANPTAGSTAAGGAYRGAAINYAAIQADPKAMFDLLDDLIDNAQPELDDIDEGGKAIYLTKSLYRALKKTYRLFPALESSKLAYYQSTDSLTYDGIQVIEMKPWEQYMKADFPTASPHLALYTAVENMVMATDLVSDMTTAEFWYERKDRFNYARVLFRIGAGFSYNILVSFAI
jgi:hypothetical protein